MFLDPESVFRITRKRRYKAQRRALDALGIRYTLAANGEPLVRDTELDRKPRENKTGPRWERLNAA